MDTSTLLTLLVIACLYVKMTCTFCYNGMDVNEEGVYGQNTTLICISSSRCNSIQWQNASLGGFIPPTDTGHTSLNKQGRKSYMHISGLNLYDDGSYSCWCYDSSGILQGDSAICAVTLTTICQARVLASGAEFIFNNSNSSSATQNVLGVDEHEIFKVECHEDALLETSCVFQNGKTQHMGDIRAFSSCNISCILRREIREISKSCTVNIFIEVHGGTIGHQPTSVTPSTASSTNLVSRGNPLPILIPLITVVCVLLVIAIALCVYIFSPKLNERSRSKRNCNPIYPTYNAEVAPTYAMVDKKSDESMSRSASIEHVDEADNSYTYVNTANGVNISDQQDSTTIESSVTTNLYFEVSKANDSGEMNGRDAMEHIPTATNEVYTEVRKEDGVVQNNFEIITAGKEGGGGYDKVSDIQKENQATKNLNLSPSVDQILDYEDLNKDDPDGNEFAGLYAVVDKTKKKSQQD